MGLLSGSKLLKLLPDLQAFYLVLTNNSEAGNHLCFAGLAPIYLGSNIDQMLPGQMPSFSSPWPADLDHILSRSHFIQGEWG